MQDRKNDGFAEDKTKARCLQVPERDERDNGKGEEKSKEKVFQARKFGVGNEEAGTVGCKICIIYLCHGSGCGGDSIGKIIVFQDAD